MTPVRTRVAAARAETVLRLFYAFFPFWALIRLDSLAPLWSPPPLEPPWPIAWLDWVGPERGAPMILVLFAVGAGLGVLAPHLRVARIIAALGLLELLALEYAFGKIHHLMHGWLYASLMFAALLPSSALRPRSASPTERVLALRVVHGAQAMLALTYTLAGVGKLLGSAYQAALGQITPLHPSALARHVADRLLQTFPDAPLGPLAIEYGSWLWPAMLGTLYLQTFAVVAVARPSLHRLWAAGLIGFHAVTALTMGIDFSPNVLLLGLLFAASPFAPSEDDPGRIVRDLPIFGRGFSRLRASLGPGRAAERGPLSKTAS